MTYKVPLKFIFIERLFHLLIPIQSNYLTFLVDPKRNRVYPKIMDWSDNEACFSIGTIEGSSKIQTNIVEDLFALISQIFEF